MNIKQTEFEYISYGRSETAILSEVAGVIILELWDGEITYTFQTVGRPSGRYDVSFVSAAVCCPIQQEVISFEALGDGWKAALRAVIDRLVHELAQLDGEHAFSKDSEHLIAEHVYKALLRQSGCCCPECGAEDLRSGTPGCSVCRQVRAELVKEAELAAGWDPSP